MEIPNWDTVRVQDQSLIPEVDLLYAEFENEEYVHIETEEDGIAVLWSSQLALPAVIDAAHTHMGTAEDNDEYWSRVVFTDNTEEEMNPARIESLALQRAGEVTYYTGAYGEGLVSWRIPKVKMIGGQILHSEICYTERNPILETIINLISSTATSQVVSAIEKDPTPIVEKVKMVLSK